MSYGCYSNMAAKRYNLPFKIMSASKLNKTKQ